MAENYNTGTYAIRVHRRHANSNFAVIHYRRPDAAQTQANGTLRTGGPGRFPPFEGDAPCLRLKRGCQIFGPSSNRLIGAVVHTARTRGLLGSQSLTLMLGC